MKHSLLFSLVCLGSILISCNKDEEVKPGHNTTITLTGFENGTYKLDATFLYVINDGNSTLFLTIDKEGTPNFKLKISLDKYDPNTDLEETIYSYSQDPNAAIFLSTVIFMGNPHSGKIFQIMGSGTSKTNQIEVTSITSTNIKGRFEANIVDLNISTGEEDTIRVLGTFDATGVTENYDND